MRPVPVSDAFQGRLRKSSLADAQATTSWTDPRNAAPTTFFLTKESDLEKQETASSQRERDSAYGVQSIEEAVSEAVAPLTASDAEDPTPVSRRRSTIKPKKKAELPRDRSSSSTSSSNVHNSPNTSASRPPTPLFLASPGEPSSLPSSPKSMSARSLRRSESESGVEDTGSQAVTSGGEDEDQDEDEDQQQADTVPQLQDSAPQLIMPSIKMPSRRPFTQRGKDIGKFKVLIAGLKGTGKTSLIKSIVQSCDDIVHVDPLSPSVAQPETFQSQKLRMKPPVDTSSTTLITEIYASTKPYPSWRSDLDESRILKRRKSIGDAVLERNLCFVDTSGTVQADTVVQYMEQQFARALAAANAGGNDLVGLLSGSGGSQVDVILYLVSPETLSSDLESMQRLSSITNVVPILSKADTLSNDEVEQIKSKCRAKFEDHLPRPFVSTEGALRDQTAIEQLVEEATRPQAPYAISSSTSNDPDTMDASLLMSPEYVQPLIPSELANLVQVLFESDTISWLRYTAAKKLVHHCRHHHHRDMRVSASPTTNPLSPSIGASTPYSFLNSPVSSPSNSQVLVSYSVGMEPAALSQNYTLARLADHTQREERFAQVRLAKWATDLQRSIQNERERYEKIARGDRAVWLTERLGECVVDGTLVPINQISSSYGNTNDASTGLDPNKSELVRFTPRMGRGALVDRADPLGLLRWNDRFQRRGWVAMQVLTGFGVVGAVALWVARHWESFGLGSWGFESSSSGGGGGGWSSWNRWAGGDW